MTEFQKKCKEIGPSRLSFITGISIDTVKKWSAGYREPDKFKQKHIMKIIHGSENEHGTSTP